MTFNLANLSDNNKLMKILFTLGACSSIRIPGIIGLDVVDNHKGRDQKEKHEGSIYLQYRLYCVTM